MHRLIIIARPHPNRWTSHLTGLSVILLACSLLSCTTLEPRPMPTWRETVHPLYPPVVGIVTNDQYIGNGVVIHSSASRGTYILTLDHVIQPAPQQVRVLVFKHSYLSPPLKMPDFHYIEAIPLLREWRTTDPFANALDDLITLLETIWGRDDIDYKTIAPSQHQAYQNLTAIVARLKHPKSEALFTSYLEDFKTSVQQLNMSHHEATQLSEAMAERMGLKHVEALFDDLLARINTWAITSGQLMEQGGAVTEFAILQLKTDALSKLLHHAVSCASDGVFRQPNIQLTYASIYPKREPNTGRLVTQEGYRVGGNLQAGQSGSPVFYQQNLVGLIARKASHRTGYLMPLHTIQTALEKAGFEWMLTANTLATLPCGEATQVQAQLHHLQLD